MLQTILKLPFKYPWIAVLVLVITFGLVKIGSLKLELQALEEQKGIVRAELAASQAKLIEIEQENTRIELALRKAMKAADEVERRLEEATKTNQDIRRNTAREIERIKQQSVPNTCEDIRDFLIKESGS